MSNIDQSGHSVRMEPVDPSAFISAAHLRRDETGVRDGEHFCSDKPFRMAQT